MPHEDTRDRIGTLGGNNVYLAKFRDRPYIKRIEDVLPDRQDIPGEPGKVLADPFLRRWHIDDWSGGEGEPVWIPGSGRVQFSQDLQTQPNGRGIGSAHPPVKGQITAAGGDMDQGKILGYGLGKLWAVLDTAGHSWDPDNDEWSAAVTTGAGTSDATSLVGGHDTFMYSGHESGAIWQWKTGSSTEHYAAAAATPFTYAPVVTDFEGILYALDGDDLFVIDKTVTDTRTQKGDTAVASSAIYLGTTPQCYRRLSTSDKGPIWLQYTDDGQTFIHEYNQFTDTHEKIGRLPVDFAFPYSIFFTQGFYFVGFRYAAEHDLDGEPYVYFQRGSQRGVIGPFRTIAGDSASNTVLIGGVIENKLYISYSGIWTYDFSNGAIQHINSIQIDNDQSAFLTFGKDAFYSQQNSASDHDIYQLDSAQWTGTGTAHARFETGMFDFGYPGLNKILYDITVVADPLPANAEITVEYRADGGSYTAHADTWDTDGETSHVFTVSSSASTFNGRDFEIMVRLGSSVALTTPIVVRSVTARAAAAESVIEFFLELDVSQREDDLETSTALIADLVTAAQSANILAFVNPWDDDVYAPTQSYDVRVIDLQQPHDGQSEAYASVRLRVMSTTDIVDPGPPPQ